MGSSGQHCTRHRMWVNGNQSNPDFLRRLQTTQRATSGSSSRPYTGRSLGWRLTSSGCSKTTPLNPSHSTRRWRVNQPRREMRSLLHPRHRFMPQIRKCHSKRSLPRKRLPSLDQTPTNGPRAPRRTKQETSLEHTAAAAHQWMGRWLRVSGSSSSVPNDVC